jgi:hypothetical protein
MAAVSVRPSLRYERLSTQPNKIGVTENAVQYEINIIIERP